MLSKIDLEIIYILFTGGMLITAVILTVLRVIDVDLYGNPKKKYSKKLLSSMYVISLSMLIIYVWIKWKQIIEFIKEF